MEDNGAPMKELAYIHNHPRLHLRVSNHLSLEQHLVYFSVVNYKSSFCWGEVQIPAHKVSIGLSDNRVVVEKDMREPEDSSEILDSGDSIGE